MKMILAVMAALVLLGVVNEMSYNDAVAEQESYCEMVKAGAWPNKPYCDTESGNENPSQDD